MADPTRATKNWPDYWLGSGSYGLDPSLKERREHKIWSRLRQKVS